MDCWTTWIESLKVASISDSRSGTGTSTAAAATATSPASTPLIAQRYAEHFGARVWIHDADRDAVPFATDIITTTAEVAIFPGLIAFAMPGHTRGSLLYLHNQRHLFSGDTLAWSRQTSDVRSIETIWYSRREHHRSLARLARSAHRFEHIFPGHG